MSDPFDLSCLPPFRIGAATIHPDRLMVERDGRDIRLERRQMQLLVVLAAEPGRVFDKEKLLQRVWGTTARSDAVLHKNISILRDALGDDRSAPTYIKTVQGLGYRLVAQVVDLDGCLIDPLQATSWAGRNPYVGLSAFDDAHEGVFRGRDALVKGLIEAIGRQRQESRRFVLVVGSSGCGKTSLLQAGVLPKLIREEGCKSLQALSVARCDFAEAQPGELLQHLVAALQSWRLGGRPVFADVSAATLAERLAEHPATVGAALDDAWLKCAPQLKLATDDAHLLLVIDHAEALVSHSTENSGSQERESMQRGEHAQVEAVIEAICSHPRGGALVVVRGDYYAQLAEAMPALMRRKGGTGHVDVPLPQPGEITDMIRQPAQLAGLRFEQHPETRACLDDALRDAAAGQPDALPLLQHCLQALYEARRDDGLLSFAAYDAIGGLEGALAHRADTVFDALPEHVRARLDTVLALLTRLETDTDRVSAGPVLWSSLPDESARTLVETFIRARLFVAGHNDGRPDFRVAHEALLRQWPRAREWAEDNRRLLLAKAQVLRAAGRWDEGGRRDDHLLNPGRPLGEALEVMHRFSDDIGGRARALILASETAARRRRRARTLATTAMAVLTFAAVGLAAIAMQARTTAENRERESQSLNDFMLGPLADELRRRDMLQALEDISDRAIEHLESRDVDTLGADAQAQVARAYRTLGEVVKHSRGNPPAEPAFREAHRLAGRILDRHPDHREGLYERGNASYWLGLLHFEAKQYAPAHAHWSDYLRDAKRLNGLDPGNPRWVMEESYAENNLGSLSLRLGDTDTAKAHFDRSLEKKDDLIALAPDNLDYRFGRIDSLTWLASTYEASGQLDKAADIYDTSIEQLQTLIGRNRTANRWRQRLANHMMLGATVEMDRGDLDKAERRIGASLRILEALDVSSDNTDTPLDLAKARLTRAEIAAARSQREVARTTLERVHQTLSTLDEKTRETQSWRWLGLRTRFASAMLDTGDLANVRADAAISGLHALAADTGDDHIRASHGYALLLRGVARGHGNLHALANDDMAAAIRAIEATQWRRHPHRSWIWSEAMRRSGRAAGSSAVTAWLEDIGYRRSLPLAAFDANSDTGLRP